MLPAIPLMCPLYLKICSLTSRRVARIGLFLHVSREEFEQFNKKQKLDPFILKIMVKGFVFAL